MDKSFEEILAEKMAVPVSVKGREGASVMPMEAMVLAVLNPTRLPPARWLWIYKVLGYRLTLLYDLWHLLRCDGITMLDGWQHSRGARLEKATAEIFNIKELCTDTHSTLATC